MSGGQLSILLLLTPDTRLTLTKVKSTTYYIIHKTLVLDVTWELVFYVCFVVTDAEEKIKALPWLVLLNFDVIGKNREMEVKRRTLVKSNAKIPLS